MGLAVALAVALPAFAQPQEITVQGPSGAAVTLDAKAIAAMPSRHLEIGFATEHGPFHAAFDGPLLWTVLVAAHAFDPAKPRAEVRDIVIVTGSDGYAAAIALGEISPAFEGKQILLADRMNGKELAAGNLRIVVPGDKYGGRSVRDVENVRVYAIGQQ